MNRRSTDHFETATYAATGLQADLLSLSRIRQRLLHPGAETKDIIRGYVLIIKALRVIDTTGVLLHTIAQPIRAYLKSVRLSLHNAQELDAQGIHCVDPDLILSPALSACWSRLKS
jgi:hypothetical protein